MAAIPAPLSGRLRLAEAAGRRIVEMVGEDLRPSRVLTPAAFAQAIRRDQDMWQKLIRERNIKVEF